MLAATLLKRAGAAVRVAGSVREALAQVESETPSVVLTDIGMPDEDGYALLSELKQREGALGRTIRTAALTAYASSGDAHRALAAGFHGYLTKPINAAELITAVARLASGEPAASVPAAAGLQVTPAEATRH
jgi:CheY-like chemotaxis protein